MKEESLRIGLISLLFALGQLITWLGVQTAAEAQDSESNRRNIVLFVADDLSPTLGCYGDKVAVTPNIDALASEGLIFDHAFATTASSSASHSAILSGLHSHKNGQYGEQHHFHNFASFHDVVVLSLPVVLAKAGYRTARIGEFAVAPEKVYHFERQLKANDRNPVQMAEKCRSLIEANDERPFFLYFAPADPGRSGAVDRRSDLDYLPDMFGNRPNRGKHFDVAEVFHDPKKIPVPAFLPDSLETREELAHYYQSCSRVDQGLGQLVKILKDADQYDQTLIIFTSDQGMDFVGATATLYEPGLHVPLIVREPTRPNRRAAKSNALVSHVDLAPSILDFAQALDPRVNGPREWTDPNLFWRERGDDVADNRSGGHTFRSYHGKSWLSVLDDTSRQHHDEIFASHTFDEITMYYPMRAIRDRKFKLIWNIAHQLDFPLTARLQQSAGWRAQFNLGRRARYGARTVGQFLRRPEFELYELQTDPGETKNLALEPGYSPVLDQYQRRLRELQEELNDPWMSAWKQR